LPERADDRREITLRAIRSNQPMAELGEPHEPDRPEHPDRECQTRAREARSEHGRASEEKDRKSTRLNSSHVSISSAVFCLKKKNLRNTSRYWSEPWVSSGSYSDGGSCSGCWPLSSRGSIF